MFGDGSGSKSSVWISYGFIHFAYLLFIATPLFVRRGKAGYIYGRSLYPITATYFIVELITGITLILVAPETAKATIIIQVVLAAAFMAWLLIHLIANEHTAANVEQRETELQYVKQSSARVKAILQKITDKFAVQKVEQLYDLLHSSQVKSNNNVQLLEKEIFREIHNLEFVADSNDLEQIITIADKIYMLAEKRNQELKLLN